MEKNTGNIDVNPTTGTSSPENNKPLNYRPMPDYDVYNSDGVVIGRDC